MTEKLVLSRCPSFRFLEKKGSEKKRKRKKETIRVWSCVPIIIIILTVKFKYLCVVNVAGKGEGKKQKKYGGPVMEKSLRVTTRYRYMSNGP